jgi:hypothetical protein
LSDPISPVSIDYVKEELDKSWARPTTKENVGKISSI